MASEIPSLRCISGAVTIMISWGFFFFFFKHVKMGMIYNWGGILKHIHRQTSVFCWSIPWSITSGINLSHVM